MESNQIQTAGIVFAAGRGTRLAPLTDKIPKPLATVGDKTLLEINLQKIYEIVDFYVLVVGYKKELIKEKLGNNFRGKKIIYANQENPKGGTLDALRTGIFYAENDLEIIQEANFLVSNSDDINDADIYNKLKNGIEKNPNMALISSKIWEDKNQLSSFGVIKKNQENEFIEIVEKPKEFISDLVSLGIYYFPNEVKNFISKAKNASTQKEDYITDLLNNYSQKNIIKVVSTRAKTFPVSDLKQLEIANQELKTRN